jgi:hypothetical protein
MECPVCGTDLPKQVPEYSPEIAEFPCTRCGPFEIEELAFKLLTAKKNLYQGPILSHAIRKMHRRNKRPLLTYAIVERLLEEEHLPTAFEQSDLLLEWIGEQSHVVGAKVDIPGGYALETTIGAADNRGLRHHQGKPRA